MKARNRASKALAATVVVLLVATALRLAALGQVPPGLYRDEAYHGLDALDILQGRFAVYFSANNGREPLFIYSVALGVELLGQSPLALRIVSFFIGLLTVAATVAMGRALFSRRLGLVAGAVLAVTLWHVHLSRVAFRSILLPLLTALTIWQGVWGIRRGRWRHWLAAGVFYGLSFYTYIPALLTPVALVFFGLYALVTQRQARAGRLWRGIGLAAFAALVTIAPLGAYTVAHPEIVLGRAGQVSILDPAIHGGNLWGALGTHVLRTMGMFFVRGDRIWRHNVPWRPVFDPALGGAFLLGLLLALRRFRRDPAPGFVLIWTAVMTLPTLLAEDAPHFLRGVGMLPVVVFLPAMGLDWLTRVSTKLRPFGWLLVAGVLLFGLGSTSWAYFCDYARDPMTGYWFERGAVELAGRINGYLGVGWDGERTVRGGPGDRWAYLDPGLWEQWPQVRFLVAAPEALTVGLEPEELRGPAAVFIWPYDAWQRAWAPLPRPAEISVEEGPLSQGDRDPEPHTTYLAFFGAPTDLTAPAVARFSGGVELLGATVTPVAEDRLRVQLRWRATAPLEEDYTVFLHYLRDGARIAQGDSSPARGRYPTSVWYPGDVINDDHDVIGVGTPIPGRDALLLGLWQPESGAALHLLDDAGNPAGDWIVVPVDG